MSYVETPKARAKRFAKDWFEHTARDEKTLVLYLSQEFERIDHGATLRERKRLQAKMLDLLS